MNITLPPELERALVEEARRLGTTPELLVIESLQARLGVSSVEESLEAPSGTLADLLAGHIGVLDSGESAPGGARMSEDTGKKFAAIVAAKRRQRRSLGRRSVRRRVAAGDGFGGWRGLIAPEEFKRQRRALQVHDRSASAR